MTKEKVLEVVANYRKEFEKLGVPKKKHSCDSVPSSSDIAAHCHAMLDDIEVLLEEEKTGKALRWLGFIQGCLWTEKRYVLKELKSHNRSEE